MLYRNDKNDLIYKRESDGEEFFLMEGMTVGNGDKQTYDIIIVFDCDSCGDFKTPVTWFYGATFAYDEAGLLQDLKQYVGC